MAEIQLLGCRGSQTSRLQRLNFSKRKITEGVEPLLKSDFFGGGKGGVDLNRKFARGD